LKDHGRSIYTAAPLGPQEGDPSVSRRLPRSQIAIQSDGLFCGNEFFEGLQQPFLVASRGQRHSPNFAPWRSLWCGYTENRNWTWILPPTKRLSGEDFPLNQSNEGVIMLLVNVFPQIQGHQRKHQII